MLHHTSRLVNTVGQLEHVGIFNVGVDIAVGECGAVNHFAHLKRVACQHINIDRMSGRC